MDILQKSLLVVTCLPSFMFDNVTIKITDSCVNYTAEMNKLYANSAILLFPCLKCVLKRS